MSRTGYLDIDIYIGRDIYGSFYTGVWFTSKCGRITWVSNYRNIRNGLSFKQFNYCLLCVYKQLS